MYIVYICISTYTSTLYACMNANVSESHVVHTCAHKIDRKKLSPLQHQGSDLYPGLKQNFFVITCNTSQDLHQTVQLIITL